MLQFYSQARTYLRSTDLSGSLPMLRSAIKHAHCVCGKCHQTRDAKDKIALFGQIQLPSHNFVEYESSLGLAGGDFTSGLIFDDVMAIKRRAVSSITIAHAQCI